MNSSESDQPTKESGQPESDFRSFQEGLIALASCQYASARESFRKALDEYQKSNLPDRQAGWSKPWAEEYLPVLPARACLPVNGSNLSPQMSP